MNTTTGTSRGWVAVILLTLGLLAPMTARAQFFEYRTKDMRLLYHDPAQYFVIPHMARSFEMSSRFHRSLFHYTPTEDVTVFLHDMNDYGTGGANSVPWNFIIIGLEPYDYTYETGPTNERMTWVMNHEYFHVLAMDKASATDRLYRSLFFGKVNAVAEQPLSMLYSYLTNPRWYSPRWYHEGGAVFMETWMSGGIGRALGGYDEMVFRTMVKDSSYFYDYVGLESEGTTIDFQIGANSYLYGTRFISYLGLTYGPEKFLRWFDRSDSSSAYYASQFSDVYGLSLDSAWHAWINFEHEWQAANLDSLRRFPITRERHILSEPIGSVSRAFYDSTSGSMIMAVNYPGDVPRLAAVNIHTGTVRTLGPIYTPALYYVCSLAFDRAGRKIFYTTNNSRYWRSVYEFDLNTGDARPLMKDCRIGDLVFNNADSTLWGVRHDKGISTVVKIPPPYTSWIDVVPLLYGRDIFDLDIAPDGKYLSASMVEINGRQRLIRLNLDSLHTGAAPVEVLYEFANNSPENFVYSADGRYLYGTSYYTGVSNIFRYNFASKEIEAMTNTEAGFFRPVPISNDSLFAFCYTGRGFMPAMLPLEVRQDVNPISYLGNAVIEKYPVLKSWKVDPPSPERVHLDTLVLDSSGTYSGMRSIAIASIYPIVEQYREYTAAGLRLNFLDPLGFHSGFLSGSYTPSKNVPANERFHISGEYRYWQWTLGANYNGADFYDLFGPTKTSRKGYSVYAEYGSDLINERPILMNYSLAAAYYGGLNALPDFQNVAVAVDKFETFRASLNYASTIKTLGGLEPERGFKAGAKFHTYYAASIFFPRVQGTFDYGLALPWDHSSLWLRTAGGTALQNRPESFSRFYFGGFGNNWIDYQEPRRYRDADAFPGVEIDEIGGRNFAKGMLEWVLPPHRYRRIGIPEFYATWSQLMLFTSAIETDIDHAASRMTAYNAGLQLDTQMVLFSHLESTLSFGYARAFGPSIPSSDEFMVSLRVLK